MELTPLRYFKDMHQNEVAFVCGAGTSLLGIPKNIGDYGKIICINSSAGHFDKVDYLFITDSAVFHMTYFESILEKSDTIILANPGLEGHAELFIKQGKKCFLMTRSYEDHHNYNFNHENVLCLGQDATLPGTHLAYVMGFKEIVLCGVDLCYSNGERYFDPNSFIHNDDSPHKEIFANEYKTGKINKDYETDIWLFMALPCWSKVFDQTRTDRILNASAISKVPHFRKVEINEYLEGLKANES